jgi:hypothetical protein
LSPQTNPTRPAVSDADATKVSNTWPNVTRVVPADAACTSAVDARTGQAHTWTPINIATAARALILRSSKAILPVLGRLERAADGPVVKSRI